MLGVVSGLLRFAGLGFTLSRLVFCVWDFTVWIFRVLVAEFGIWVLMVKVWVGCLRLCLLVGWVCGVGILRRLVLVVELFCLGCVYGFWVVYDFDLDGLFGWFDSLSVLEIL